MLGPGLTLVRLPKTYTKKHRLFLQLISILMKMVSFQFRKWMSHGGEAERRRDGFVLFLSFFFFPLQLGVLIIFKMSLDVLQGRHIIAA